MKKQYLILLFSMSFILLVSVTSVAYAEKPSPPSPEAVEEGSFHWLASGYSGIYLGQHPSNVRSQACGEDYLVDFYGVPENIAFNKRVYAKNPVSQAHIYANFGLDGFYYCVGGACTISLCSTEYGDPWSLRLMDW